MYKQPTIRKRPHCTKFVSEVRPNGACVSNWVAYTPPPSIWTGQGGRAGEIITAMHRGTDHVARPKTEWRPPHEYELVAKHMHEASRAAYIARCKAWFDANKPPERVPRAPLVYDRELVQVLFQKYAPRVPPLEERVKVYRAAGLSETFIERAIARHKRLEAISEEQQKTLDAIFGKWPSANKTVKVPPKVIKAVKKKMA
jgi:hypothetical protein